MINTTRHSAFLVITALRIFGNQQDPTLRILGNQHNTTLRIFGNQNTAPHSAFLVITALRIFGNQQDATLRILGNQHNTTLRIFGIRILGNRHDATLRIFVNHSSTHLWQSTGRDATHFRNKRKRNHSTQDSHVVPHHGTNWAALCLTAQIGRDAVLSKSYGRG